MHVPRAKKDRFDLSVRQLTAEAIAEHRVAVRSNVEHTALRDDFDAASYLTRAGYPAHASPWEQHQLFEAWVWKNAYERFDAALQEGERICVALNVHLMFRPANVLALTRAERAHDHRARERGSGVSAPPRVGCSAR